MWQDLKLSRELGWRLFVRDTSAMYRQSFLGILWALILPLANALTWLFLRSSGIVSLRETDIPYPVYVFAGSMLWSIFIESILAPLQKTLMSKSMLTKLNFPREAILLSGIYQSMFNSCIKMFILIIGLILLGYYSMGWTLLLFPLGILSLILAGTSIGLLITPIGLLYTDISKGLPLVLQFFMFLTPVVFPIPKSGWVSTIISYNPVTPLIMTTRDWLTGSTANFIDGFILVNIFLAVLLIIVWIVYRAALPILIERMSSN
jgi:lipopolysaccharide transport system permease protein